MKGLKKPAAIIIVVIVLIVTTMVIAAAGEIKNGGTALPGMADEPFGIGATTVITTEKYVTAPYDFPIFTVETAGSGIADGYIFISYFSYTFSDPVAYQLILDNEGQPIYYNRSGYSFDFKVQPNGNITYFDASDGERRYIEIDNQYQVVNTHEIGNGYVTDNHDLQLLDSGNWLILADDARLVDMSQIVVGGDPEATVVGCVVQEIDDAGNVIFEWNSFDHIPITDSYADLTGSVIRYVHCNAIEFDVDGNLLVSNRNLQEITKINRQTGDIIWRLGGKQNEFTFVNDSGFNYQHDIRRLPNGNLTIYDNRTGIVPNYSRAVNYVIDEQNLVVALVGEYRHTPDIYGAFMGSYRNLPNGNRLIGWGTSSQPMLTEVNGADQVVFELSADFPYGTYRAFRLPWEGHPTWPPVLSSRQEGAGIMLYFSWNGSTDVVEYYVYGSAGTDPVDLLAVVPKDGFETSYEFIPPGDGVYSFQVEARGAGSTSLSYSNISYVIVGGSPAYLPVFAVSGSD